MSLPLVIVHLHATAARAAQCHALQQRGAVARRCGARATTEAGVVLVQPPLVLLEGVPAQIALVGVVQQDGPLLARALPGGPPARRSALLGPPKDIRPGVARVVQYVQGTAVGQRVPHQLPHPRAVRRPAGEAESLGVERRDHRARRSVAATRRKQQRDRVAHLPIGIELHVVGGIVDEAHGEPDPQLPPAGFGEVASLQPRAQQVQLRLAHRALEPQQEPIVEVRRIVDAVFVEDQRIGEGADLEEPMPVAAVAGQPRYLEPHDDPGLTQAHLGDQALEAGAARRRGGGDAQVVVDDDDLLVRPAEGHRAAAQVILATRAFGVLKDLMQGRLSDIETSRVGPR